jgi:hypothetical protein
MMHLLFHLLLSNKNPLHPLLLKLDERRLVHPTPRRFRVRPMILVLVTGRHDNR